MEDSKKDKSSKNLEEEVPEEVNLERESEEQRRIRELEERIEDYESKEAGLKEELNKKFLDLIQRKSEEASELIRKKEREIEAKYSLQLEEKRKFLYERELTELVNIVSRLEDVVNCEVKSEEVRNYLLGFKMILNQFEHLFEELSIKVISPAVDEEFDSELMESLETEEVSEENRKNKILKVFSRGYKLHERVIKLAQVKVGI